MNDIFDIPMETEWEGYPVRVKVDELIDFLETLRSCYIEEVMITYGREFVPTFFPCVKFESFPCKDFVFTKDDIPF